MKFNRSVLWSLMLVGALSCGDDGYEGDSSTMQNSTPTPPVGDQPSDGGGTTPPPPGGTTGTASFARDIQPIFTSNCALAGCHAGASPTAGQDLSEGKAFASIAGVAARSSCAGQLKVNPGNPDGSVLVKKIEGTTCGSRMPLGRTPLGSDQIALIRAWIQEGAQNN